MVDGPVACERIFRIEEVVLGASVIDRVEQTFVEEIRTLDVMDVLVRIDLDPDPLFDAATINLFDHYGNPVRGLVARYVHGAVIDHGDSGV